MWVQPAFTPPPVHTSARPKRIQVIHEAVASAALSRGMLPLPRLSLLHVRRFAAMCGAVPIADVAAAPAQWRRCLGLLGGVAVRTDVGPRPLLALLPPPPPLAAGPQDPVVLGSTVVAPLAADAGAAAAASCTSGVSATADAPHALARALP
eukprot:364365-Chlamydomonas_euryale.AAC.1